MSNAAASVLVLISSCLAPPGKGDDPPSDTDGVGEYVVVIGDCDSEINADGLIVLEVYQCCPGADGDACAPADYVIDTTGALVVACAGGPDCYGSVSALEQR